MNILFVSYGDLRSNSINHIAPYANELSSRGHACAVATEGDVRIESSRVGRFLFAHYTYDQLLQGKEAFPDAKPADLIHAWTPRENTRRLVETYRSRFPAARLVIHLEDDEDAILESAYQQPIDRLRHPGPEDHEPVWQPRLSHPVHYKRFLASADAVTLLAASLDHLLPVPKPTLLIRPIAPLEAFSRTEANGSALARIQFPPDRKLIVFPGGITSGNREDVRNLYLAVKLLNDRNVPCHLIKTGPSCPELEDSFAFPLGELRTDLGYVEDSVIPSLLRAASALVQPGKDNAFNRGRFPCKIPEFLASGTPCVIPSYYEPAVEDPSCCLALRQSTPGEIANAIERIFADPALAQKLGRNGRAYAQRRYAATENTDRLLQFYEETLRRGPVASPKHYTETNLRTSNRELTDENARLRKQLCEAEEHSLTNLQLLAKIQDHNAEQQREIARLQDRIDRMRRSFSWSVTMPLRFLRRHTLDRYLRLPPPADFPTGPSEEPAGPSPSPAPTLPPEGHPSYHKDYYKFVIADERRIADYLSDYRQRVSEEIPEVKISILLPVFNVAETWLRHCLDSVLAQVYPHWELCVADDCSDRPHVREVLEEYARREERVHVVYREVNGHISMASNSASTLATGRYLCLLDHDDELAPHALACVADCIARNPHAKLIYSDEDKIDEHGWRHGPHFKSDWNYELFLGCNMISHLGVYRRDAFDEAGGFREGFEGAQDWDLALRVVERCRPREIVHIPDVLYHWRSIHGSTAHSLDQKTYAKAAQKRAIEAHLARVDVTATVEPTCGVHWAIRYPLPEPQPRVDIIIPTKDRLDLLQPCIASVLEKTSYSNYGILIVDHASESLGTLQHLQMLSEDPRIRIKRIEGTFNFSALNNAAIAQSKASIVCLLNNDVEVITHSWLSELVSHASRPRVGVVGAKLLFPHEHVQHGGVILGVGGIAAHAFKYLHKDDDGHIGRARLVSEFSAVTGACMAFRRSLWMEIGGFDAEHLAIAYNDVDFCLRARAKGYANLVTPFAMLYHKESASRGPETEDTHKCERFAAEVAYMRRAWGSMINNDPLYNPNLTRDREDFSYRIIR